MGDKAETRGQISRGELFFPQIPFNGVKAREKKARPKRRFWENLGKLSSGAGGPFLTWAIRFFRGRIILSYSSGWGSVRVTPGERV